MHSPIALALVYLLAMILMVPLAKRLGLGAVLGYLIAGSLLGPHVLNLASNDNSEVMHLAEFGVIMMLFIIGLELKPATLWKLRGPIFGLGSMQVALTAAAIFLISLAFKFPWQFGLALGLTVAMSSTAIVLQTFQEKGVLKTDGGEASFSVLLFQDIAVIPILTLITFLASSLNGVNQSANPGESGLMQSVKIVAAVIGVIVIGKTVVRPAFRIVLNSHIRELTTALGLVVVLGTTLAMNAVGLSPALGAFLAGVVLAESEYRHQLESDIEPFKALLLGVFFISIGAQINYLLVVNNATTTLLLVLSILIIKFLVLWIIAKLAKLSKPDQLLFAFGLCQGGEFAFVLLNYSLNLKLLTQEQNQMLIASIALSMAAAPLLIGGYIKFIQPLFASKNKDEREADTIDNNDAPIIVAGQGRFGQMATRLLRAAGYFPTVLDYDVEQVDTLRKFGFKAFYGDASRVDLLRAAGIEKAKLLVLAIDDADKTLEIVDTVKQNFTHIKIFVRAYDRLHAYKLIHKGIDNVYIETAGSAVDLAKDVLVNLGFRAKHAFDLGQKFKKRNNQSIRELAKLYHEADEQTYILHAKNWLAALEQTLQADKINTINKDDHGWESAPRD